MNFTLHPNLEKKTHVIDLPLCRVLLEDEQAYPWLFLVPRREGISRMMDLPPADQLQLLQELDFAQKLMWNEFRPDQLNVAAIGNKTPQLHIHVIARYENDPAWPHTVWDHPARSSYEEGAKQALLLRLRALFSGACKMHELSMIGDIYLKTIMSGKKRYEGRIYSDKCKEMVPGDLLKLYEESLGWGIVCKIVALHPFSTFKEMCEKLGVSALLPHLSHAGSQEDVLDNALKIYEAFPGSERVSSLGCVGIEVEFLYKV